MYDLGIISSDFIGTPLIKPNDYESLKLYETLKKQGISTIFIDPSKIHIELLDEEIALFYQEEMGDGKLSLFPINKLKAILIRRTRGFAEQIYDFIALLDKWAPNTKVYDPASSFIRPLSKISSFNKRFSYFNQPRSLIIPSDNVPGYLPLEFPIIAKPSHGWRGYGVAECKSIEDLHDYFNNRDKTLGYAVILQEKISTCDEYRVFVINGKSIGAVFKSNPGKIAKNAAQEGRFIQRNIAMESELVKVAESCAQIQKLAFAGVDLCIHNKEIYILECNRNPEFREFENATKVNVAEKIIQFIIQDAKLEPMKEAINQKNLIPSEIDMQKYEILSKKIKILESYILSNFKELNKEIDQISNAIIKDAEIKQPPAKHQLGINVSKVLSEIQNKFLLGVYNNLTDKLVITLSKKIIDLFT